MKIRFWRENNIIIVTSILTVSCVRIISDYIKTDIVELWKLFGGVIICAVYFVPNYFSNILEITDKLLIIKNGVFQKAINIELESIKFVNLVMVNHVVVSIAIKLHNGNEIPWYTQDRTQEIYNILMKYSHSRWESG